MQDRIIEMLGRGIAAAQVAAAVGCDDSYISQLIANEEFASKVQALRAEHFANYIETDQHIDTAEDEALKRLASLVPFITKPAEAARVFGVLNGARRRASDRNASGQAQAQTVVLDIPEAARVTFTTTADRQVIEIAGRSMTTMPAKSLAAQLEQRNAQRLLNAKIPSTMLPMNASQQFIPQDANILSSKRLTPLVEQL